MQKMRRPSNWFEFSLYAYFSVSLGLYFAGKLAHIRAIEAIGLSMVGLIVTCGAIVLVIALPLQVWVAYRRRKDKEVPPPE